MVKEHCTMVGIDNKQNKSGGTWVSSGWSGEGKEKLELLLRWGS